MAKQELDSLVRTGQLKSEPPSAGEIAGLVKSAEDRLRDADREENSVSSRFDLAYNAAHSFALAALRWHGYRPDQRYIVFQALAHTVSMPASQWRVLADAHRKRNQIEYEGTTEVDPQFLEAVLRVTHEVARRVRALVSAGDRS